MKIKIENYTFNKTAKTITFLDYATLGLDEILVIANTTSNVIIYNFAENAKGGTISGNVLTLTYNTSAMANTDKLLIYIDDTAAGQAVSNSDMYLKAILNALLRPIWIDPTTGRLNINTATSVTTVSTVTTAADVTRINTVGATAATAQSTLYVQLYGQERLNWARSVRALIT